MLEKKFINTFNVDDWEVETDTGWEDIKAIGKTIEYQVYLIKTKSYKLRCADTHIVFDDKMNEIYVKDLKNGDKIQTKNGIEKVINTELLNYSEHMYDLELSEGNRRFYTSGILSHNSIWLSNFASNAVRLGHNVVVISLELKDRKFVKRIGANLLNISMNEYKNYAQDSQRIKEKLAKMREISGMTMSLPGKLFVKQYPAGSAGIPDFENYICRLEERIKEKINLVLIDYINITKNWRNPNTENTYSKIKQISEDFRAMLTRNDWAGGTVSQVTRSAFGSSDITMANIAESAGLVHTVDALFAINKPPLETGTQGTYNIKALALRDSQGMGDEQRFLCDYNYMRITQDPTSVASNDIFNV